MEKFLGIHILLDMYACQTDLDNPEIVHAFMLQAAEKAKTTVLNSYVHRFYPQGVSCVVVISESHLSIHTWPEFKHAQVDVFTCGDNALPTNAVDFLHECFKPGRSVIYRRDRGELEIIKSYLK